MWISGATSKYVSSLTPAALQEINKAGSIQQRIDEALNRNLYTLAAIIFMTARTPSEISHTSQQGIIRGLTQYHPRLTPVNLSALLRLKKKWNHTQKKLDIDSFDKQELMRSLIKFNEADLVQSGLNLVINGVDGGLLPVSTIMELVTFCQKHHSVETALILWEYLKKNYLLSIDEYGFIMFELMRMFANSKKHSVQAREVARACIRNAADPAIAGGMAMVSYKLKDRGLRDDLVNSKEFQPSRITDAAKVLLDVASSPLSSPSSPLANLSEYKDVIFNLTDTEKASIIKHSAEANLKTTEKQVYHNEELPSPTKLDHIAMCNQYIEDGNFVKFNQTLRNIGLDGSLSGIRLNLKLKWEQRHGNFKHAKRHYLNWGSVPVKQRNIALHTLQRMAAKPREIEWVQSESRRLASGYDE